MQALLEGREVRKESWEGGGGGMEVTLPLISDNNKQTHNREVGRRRRREERERFSKAQDSIDERERVVIKKTKFQSLGGAPVQPISMQKFKMAGGERTTPPPFLAKHVVDSIRKIIYRIVFVLLNLNHELLLLLLL